MKKRLIIIGVVVILLIVGATYLWGPGSAPSNQQPLVTLSPANAAQFQNIFDADAASPRLVLMLSPT